MGLLSTSALLAPFEVPGPVRDPLERARRADSVKITHPVHGIAWARDNKPIIENVLIRTLDGMSLAEWYATLNDRVFFWLGEARLDRLRNAPPCRDRSHDIITLGTGRLLEVYGDVVELSPINSGAVHAGATVRQGVGTFSPIRSYPWAETVAAAPQEPILEMTVPCGIDDVDRFVISVVTT